MLTGANGQVGSSILSLLNQFKNYKVIKILKKIMISDILHK